MHPKTPNHEQFHFLIRLFLYPNIHILIKFISIQITKYYEIFWANFKTGKTGRSGNGIQLNMNKRKLFVKFRFFKFKSLSSSRIVTNSNQKKFIILCCSNIFDSNNTSAIASPQLIDDTLNTNLVNTL